MKKIMLTATALIFTVAMFAQTAGSAPASAKPGPKHVMAQNHVKSKEQKSEMKDEKKGEKKEEKKKQGSEKVKHHKGKEHPKK